MMGIPAIAITATVAILFSGFYWLYNNGYELAEVRHKLASSDSLLIAFQEEKLRADTERERADVAEDEADQTQADYNTLANMVQNREVPKQCIAECYFVPLPSLD